MQTLIKMKNIFDTLKDNGSFNILVRCIRATDLVDYLRDPNLTFTLFAPNEAAFKKLVPLGVLNDLFKNQTLLKQTIWYHLVPKIIVPEHLDGRSVVRSLEGKEIILDVTGHFMVNNANVIRPDIECANGVIHEIDTVLTPGQEPWSIK